MLRYQYTQVPNILHRWRVHVEGWLDGADMCRNITVVSYEMLNDRYDDVMDAIAKRKGWQRRYGEKPKADERTILKSQQHSDTNHYTDEDLSFFRQEIGPTMHMLGYEI